MNSNIERRPNKRKKVDVSEEDVAIAMRYVYGQATIREIERYTGKKTPAFYFVARVVINAIRRGILRITSID